MPENQGSEATGEVVEKDGRFYVDDVEVGEAEARARGWVPEPEENGHVEHDVPDVMGRLRAAYKAGQGERRKTIEIAPALYNDLAAEFKPIDFELRRKLIRRASRRGDTGPEADLSINARLMADACISMMFRPAPGEDYVQLHTLIDKYKGGEPIRFDTRLADVLGMELIGGETEGQICRLVFGDAGIFEPHFIALNGWSTQTFDVDTEEEDEGGDRPT